MTETIQQKVTPLCPFFEECDGCSYQNISYQDELEKKGQELKELFEGEFALGESVFAPVTPSPKEYHYRHRLDLGMYRRKSGEILMGFRKERGYTLSVDSCAIAQEEVSNYLPQLHKEASDKLPEKYRMANLVVRTDDTGKVHWGGIGRRSLKMEEQDYFYTEINGVRIYYSLDTFFQANLSILPTLMNTVESMVTLDKETSFYDLYGGVGLFGIYFHSQVGNIKIVESARDSLRMADYNAKFHGIEERVETVEAPVENVLEGLLAADKAQRKVAIIDPPRKGLHEAVCDCLNRAELDDLFYLSCSPTSLVRDLKLLNKGWEIEKVIPFDFFPKTVHLETLVKLRRK